MRWNFPTDKNRKPYVDKLKNPADRIVCPTCGEPLEYLDHGTAWEVRCERCGTRIVMKGF